MNNLEVVIGIEIHIELNTKTKMFSSAKNDFKSLPNENVSPTDIAYPGTLPVVNRQAVIKAIKFAKALNMSIDDTLFFDRKNYFYADLPKGFQITQNERPIGSEGTIDIQGSKILIERIHLEEDTAKSIHKNGKTFLDYNRAGVPLIEVVTHPVISTSDQAANYVKAIRDLAISLDISDAKMEEGQLRADVNISLRPHGQEELGTKVEIKNINSISNIKKSIEIEIGKQTNSILSGKEIQMATKRFDSEKDDTVVMRVKTTATDYKFFPEPNIPPIFIGSDFIKSVELSELPWERKSRYEKIGLPEKYINELLSNIEYSKFFDSIQYMDKVKLAKLFFAEIISLSNSLNKRVHELNIKPSDISEVLNKMDEGIISGKHAKEIFPILAQSDTNVSSIINEKGMRQISDESSLNKIIDSIIIKNAAFISKNEERPDRIAKFILGQLMKESKGQANPVIASKLVNKKMEK